MNATEAAVGNFAKEKHFPKNRTVPRRIFTCLMQKTTEYCLKDYSLYQWFVK